MVANPLKGETTLTAAGASYVLCFPSNVIVQVEQLFGGVAIGTLAANMTHVENVRALLWGALQKYHPDVDLLKAGDVIDECEGGINGVAEPVVRALRFRLSGAAIDAPLEEPKDK